ncbi:MAG: hypothetical protein A2V66_12630 [Ignavibacteria bacterium RBG_13_36_8]|nr:MAG: hypothetical protein A2V66_12630 [Ignavibacteria bacterium RBG_13_36_8]
MLKNKFIKCLVCGDSNNIIETFCSSCGAKLKNPIEENNSVETHGFSFNASNKTGSVETHISKQKKRNKDKFKNQITSTKKISDSRIFYLSFSLLLLVVLNLLFAGVFENLRYSVGSIQNNLNQTSGGADLNYLQEITNLEKIVTSNPGDYKTLLQLAHLLNDSGFYQRAIEKYKEYLKVRPKESDVWVDMGVCYYQQNDFENALTNMKKALEINPRHQIAHFNIGIVNFSSNNHDEAIKWWKKAIELNPNSEIAKKAEELIKSH